MYDESIEMGERLHRSGVRARSVVYPGATHSFLEALSVARVADRTLDDAARRLSEMLS